MRALRIAALGLLPLAAACWMERPNLRSTGGGYLPSAAAPASAGGAQDPRAAGSEAHEDPAMAPPPAEAAPAGS